MGTRRATTVVLTILAYVLATFTVQALSHFVINVDHYRTIPMLRPEPIFAFGVLSMLVQGAVFGVLFPVFNSGGSPIRNGLVFSWLLGAFLASYIVLGESGKYVVPSVAAWIRVEFLAAAAQFTLFGILLGAVHNKKT